MKLNLKPIAKSARHVEDNFDEPGRGITEINQKVEAHRQYLSRVESMISSKYGGKNVPEGEKQIASVALALCRLASHYEEALSECLHNRIAYRALYKAPESVTGMGP